MELDETLPTQDISEPSVAEEKQELSTSRAVLQNDTKVPFRWNSKKKDAAMLLAEDRLTDEEIAKKVGLSRNAIARWKRHPVFAAKVAKYANSIGSVIKRAVLGRKGRRMQILDDRMARIEQVIAGRAAEMANGNVAGGESGLLARTIKMIGSGLNATTVEEYAVDGVLLKETREILKQAAQEAGEWVEKSESAETGEYATRKITIEFRERVRQLGQLPIEELMRLRSEALSLPGTDSNPRSEGD